MAEKIAREAAVDWTPELRIRARGLEINDARGAWELVEWGRLSKLENPQRAKDDFVHLIVPQRASTALAIFADAVLLQKYVHPMPPQHPNREGGKCRPQPKRTDLDRRRRGGRHYDQHWQNAQGEQEDGVAYLGPLLKQDRAQRGVGRNGSHSDQTALLRHSRLGSEPTPITANWLATNNVSARAMPSVKP